MGAALAVALLALWPGRVEAGFRYVPPVEAAADTEPGPGPAVGGGSVTGTSVSSASVWRVHEGEMLREALARWGARAGTDVVFLTDRRYRLEGAAAFEGGFGDAVQALFRGLSHLPHAPVARAEGATMVVTHRLPGSLGREAVP